jgi:hypothetical protein
MTKAQEVYERVEALVATGVRKADAFRQVAEEYGQPFNSIRGAYYAHTRASGQSNPTGPRRPRRRETMTEDAIEQATLVLNRAIEQIDAEIAAAKTRADEAKAEYEHLRETAQERKAAIEQKIAALTG